MGRQGVRRPPSRAADAHPRQRILPMDELDWELTTAGAAQTGLEQAVAEAARYPFDLSSQIPIQAWLLTADSGAHVLVLVTHHVATDGWSAGLLARDIATAYA